ncbi:trimeric intracellular cation channel family protein [Corynebacterium bovis]|uniref:trimeric intracellular cation channel family protein n=1 Tax=Corynebacterium bovis TaxID=36808 RepID=UPI003139EA62
MLLSVLYVIGITAEAVTGALAAGRQRMDLFGVSVVACVTAIGGGTVRDILLDHYPLTWVRTPVYLLVIIAAAIITVFTSFLGRYFRPVFLVLDAVGLSVFAVLGTQIALDLGHGAVIAAVSAVVTGVFGGVMRDLLCDRVPLVFSEELYASIALIAAVLYMALEHVGMPELAVVLVTLGIAASVRLVAIAFRWGLPVFEYQEREVHRAPENRLSRALDRMRGSDARLRRRDRPRSGGPHARRTRRGRGGWGGLTRHRPWFRRGGGRD